MLSKLLTDLNYCDFIKTFSPKIKNMNIKSFNELTSKINQNYIDFLVYEYIKRNRNTFIVMVWPVCQGGDDIIREHYQKFDGKIIYYKEIKLHPDSYPNFLNHISDKKSHQNGTNLWFAKPHSDKNPLRIYVIQTNPDSIKTSVQEMKTYLTKIFNGNAQHINKVHKQGINVLKNLYITTKNKRSCRLALHHAGKVPRVLKETPPFNYSHHINDFHKDTIEIGKVVLNNNTLNLMRYLKWNKLKGFNKKFNDFKNFLRVKNIDTDRVLIYNSGILGPLGIREPSDIDFLQLDKKLIRQNHLPPDIDIQNKYFKRGYMILQNKTRARYIEDQPSFMANVQINSPEIIWKLSINNVVFNPNNYYYYEGIKFMNIELFEKVKKIRGRTKDLQQVRMMKEVIKL